jgi:quercetin dioxygenase-like cupin family protein
VSLVEAEISSRQNGEAMSSNKTFIGIAVAVCCGLTAAQIAWSHEAASSAHSDAKDRARIVISKSLSQMDGNHLKAVLVEVRYGPGESSQPHSHPCAVVGYVVEGAIRSQVKGEPEMTYKAGESFYEAPNGVHLVSANASATEPARFVAYLICDHDAPLSIDSQQNIHSKGE